MSLEEAARQLELAIHDARVSFDCIGLGHLDRAHTSVITARAAVDAAETSLRAELERQDAGNGDAEEVADRVSDSAVAGRADEAGEP